jgi:peptidoglycan hydrolase-like protein with peptidoglycan-binding domain
MENRTRPLRSLTRAIGGAALGAASGAARRAGTSGGAQLTIQQQYDNAYSQCMYSKGNQVPGFKPAVVYAPPAAPPPAGASAYDRGLVLDTQIELVRLRLLAGSADGNYGPKTSAAISEYERRNNLLVDGAPSAALLAHMRAH